MTGVFVRDLVKIFPYNTEGEIFLFGYYYEFYQQAGMGPRWLIDFGPSDPFRH